MINMSAANIYLQESGLSKWLGDKLVPLQEIPPYAISILLSLLVATFTECSSNAATTTLFLPILASMVNKAHMDEPRFEHTANTLVLHVFNCVVLMYFLGRSYRAAPTVCHAAMHHRCLSGLHVACGDTAQCHRLLVWKAHCF